MCPRERRRLLPASKWMGSKSALIYAANFSLDVVLEDEMESSDWSVSVKSRSAGVRPIPTRWTSARCGCGGGRSATTDALANSPSALLRP